MKVPAHAVYTERELPFVGNVRVSKLSLHRDPNDIHMLGILSTPCTDYKVYFASTRHDSHPILKSLMTKLVTQSKFCKYKG